MRTIQGVGRPLAWAMLWDMINSRTAPLKPIPGKLYYRGMDVEELVQGLQAEDRLGFEETAFLLLRATA